MKVLLRRRMCVGNVLLTEYITMLDTIRIVYLLKKAAERVCRLLYDMNGNGNG